MDNGKKKRLDVRYTVIAVSFVAICIAYIIVLAVTQIKGPQTNYMGDEGNKRTVTVSGMRGQIYDCKGRLLVGNSTSYDLLYEYGAMPDTYAAINRALLDTLDALRITGNEDKLKQDYFPLEGIYPNVSYKAQISDTDSNEYYHLTRVLKRLELDEDTTAQELAEYYIDRYRLSERLYSQAEIRDLMRLWYEMNRVDFGPFQSYTLAENVSIELVTYIKEKGIEGVTFKTVAQRVYTYPGIASHILGRVGKITAETADHYSELGYPMDAYVGTSGCELAFESILHGQDGKMVIEYDDYGNVINTYYEKEPISGNDVWLTIDIDLQIAAERGLAEGVEATGTGEAGAITALDPNTGAVLAIASYPTYDLTQFSSIAYYDSLLNNPNTPLINRALTGVYAPGSTYKVGVALAALEQGIIDNTTTFTCNKVYPHFHRPTCLGTHGTIDVFEAIQESCNIFFYSLGHSMGIEAITNYTERLGLGASTGIELAERVGTVAGPAYSQATNDIWTAGGDAVPAAIGQSDHGYTPLQISVYMSSIVNGGTRYSAHLLDSVRHFYTNEAISTYTPTVLDQVTISKYSYTTLIESMRRVVANNSEISRYFKDVPVSVGGKSGTAEVAGMDDYALFSGFAPYDSPQIVVSCVIEEGLHGYYASIAVARVMEQYFGTEE